MSLPTKPFKNSATDKPLIIFDLDGVIVNSMNVMRLAFEAALREVVDPEIESIAVNELFERYKKHLGKGFLHIMAAINLPETLYTPFKKHSLHLQPYVYLYPGIRQALHQLSQHYYLTIVTGKDTERTSALLSQLEIDTYFTIVSGTDGHCAGKPAPDLLLRQIDKLEKNKHDVIMVGDAASDIQAARNSGVASCAALWGYTNKVQITRENPNYLASNPKQLLSIIQQHFNNPTPKVINQ